MTKIKSFRSKRLVKPVRSKIIELFFHLEVIPNTREKNTLDIFVYFNSYSLFRNYLSTLFLNQLL